MSKQSAPSLSSVATTPDAVEAQFYEALREGSLEAVMAAWSPDDDVIAVHPNGQRSLGWGEVRQTYEKLLAAGPLRVVAEHTQRIRYAGAAIHSVVERIDVANERGTVSAWVYATNVFALTAQGWRMVAHHASAGDAAAVGSSREGGAAVTHPLH